jgi:hypothetical protein
MRTTAELHDREERQERRDYAVLAHVMRSTERPRVSYQRRAVVEREAHRLENDAQGKFERAFANEELALIKKNPKVDRYVKPTNEETRAAIVARRLKWKRLPAKPLATIRYGATYKLGRVYLGDDYQCTVQTFDNAFDRKRKSKPVPLWRRQFIRWTLWATPKHLKPLLRIEREDVRLLERYGARVIDNYPLMPLAPLLARPYSGLFICGCCGGSTKGKPSLIHGIVRKQPRAKYVAWNSRANQWPTAKEHRAERARIKWNREQFPAWKRQQVFARLVTMCEGNHVYSFGWQDCRIRHPRFTANDCVNYYAGALRCSGDMTPVQASRGYQTHELCDPQEWVTILENWDILYSPECS